jgi:diguanylate cyclase (GGDEF)-like protein
VNCLSGSRIVVTAAGLLWLAHIGVVAILGTSARGPFLSDLIQLALGGLLVFSIVQTSRHAEGFARSFWRLTAAAYGVWFVAQSLGVYNDFASSPTVFWICNMLFCFWFVPMAMALFLDPEHEAGKLDAIMALDFVQGVLVCIAAYLYFFYLPKAESAGELAHQVWAPYFAGYGFVVAAFLLRAVVTHSRDAKSLFGRMGVFLALSGAVDAFYYYGPGRNLRTGAWFDLLWSAVLIVPLLIAVTWRQAEAPDLSPEAPQREKRIYSEMFCLFYPLLVLLMSLGIARERLRLAALVVFLAFVCSSARLLVTQHRMLLAKEALRREAARDGLTSVWNRKSILSILDRELQRAERDHEPVGLIMIDVDHFKIINDTRGHAAGDTVLRILASGIAAMVRPYDSVGRYGGEEFLIVAPGCGMAETWDLAERVRGYVAGCNIMVGGSSVQVSLSLGIATGECAADMEKLLRDADVALYVAKNGGRNRVAPNMSRAASAGQGSSPAQQSDFWL